VAQDELMKEAGMRDKIIKDGDRLLAELRRRAGIRDRYYQFFTLLSRGYLYTPDWLYWTEWLDAHRS